MSTCYNEVEKHQFTHTCFQQLELTEYKNEVMPLIVCHSSGSNTNSSIALQIDRNVTDFMSPNVFCPLGTAIMPSVSIASYSAVSASDIEDQVLIGTITHLDKAGCMHYAMPVLPQNIFHTQQNTLWANKQYNLTFTDSEITLIVKEQPLNASATTRSEFVHSEIKYMVPDLARQIEQIGNNTFFSNLDRLFCIQGTKCTPFSSLRIPVMPMVCLKADDVRYLSWHDGSDETVLRFDQQRNYICLNQDNVSLNESCIAGTDIQADANVICPPYSSLNLLSYNDSHKLNYFLKIQAHETLNVEYYATNRYALAGANCIIKSAIPANESVNLGGKDPVFALEGLPHHPNEIFAAKTSVPRKQQMLHAQFDPLIRDSEEVTLKLLKRSQPLKYTCPERHPNLYLAPMKEACSTVTCPLLKSATEQAVKHIRSTDPEAAKITYIFNSASVDFETDKCMNITGCPELRPLLLAENTHLNNVGQQRCVKLETPSTLSYFAPYKTCPAAYGTLVTNSVSFDYCQQYTCRLSDQFTEKYLIPRANSTGAIKFFNNTHLVYDSGLCAQDAACTEASKVINKFANQNCTTYAGSPYFGECQASAQKSCLTVTDVSSDTTGATTILTSTGSNANSTRNSAQGIHAGIKLFALASAAYTLYNHGDQIKDSVVYGYQTTKELYQYGKAKVKNILAKAKDRASRK